MCERFTLVISPEVFAKVFSLAEIPHIESRYNIAPNQPIAAVRHLADQNRLDFLKWGLIPDSSKEMDHSHISARAETVHEKPAFVHALKYNRCIIPASGFYEWVPMDSHKKPYYIRLANSSVMGFAGLWERSTAPDGTEVETCCILSTTANEIIQPLHDRMPVILQPSDYNLWLNRNMHDHHELQRLYQPYSADLMIAYSVPDLVNNPRFDSPSCIVQV
jgi:putative SOS response-associated peptidase YedK